MRDFVLQYVVTINHLHYIATILPIIIILWLLYASDSYMNIYLYTHLTQLQGVEPLAHHSHTPCCTVYIFLEICTKLEGLCMFECSSEVQILLCYITCLMRKVVGYIKS